MLIFLEKRIRNSRTL